MAHTLCSVHMTRFESFTLTLRERLRIGALTLLILNSLSPNFAWSQPSEPNPFDGMSAVDIAVQADLARIDLLPQVPAGTCTDSTDQATSIQLMQFAFAKLTGRAGHEFLVEMDSNPLPGEIDAIAELWGPWSTAEFHLVNESGVTIQPLTMIAADDEFARMYWTGMVNVPNEPFRVVVSGTDLGGTEFEITCNYLFVPQTVEVVFDINFHHADPGPLPLSAKITNYGPFDTFSLDFSNDMDLPTSGSESSIELAQDETANIILTLDIPAVSVGVLESIARITAQGTTNPNAFNHATSRVRIERFDFLFKNGFDQESAEGSF